VADVPVEGTDTEASDQVRPPCQGGREVRWVLRRRALLPLTPTATRCAPGPAVWDSGPARRVQAGVRLGFALRW